MNICTTWGHFLKAIMIIDMDISGCIAVTYCDTSQVMHTVVFSLRRIYILGRFSTHLSKVDNFRDILLA